MLVLIWRDRNLYCCFFVIFFLFLLTFLEDIILKDVAARHIYTTIEGIETSVILLSSWSTLYIVLSLVFLF